MKQLKLSNTDGTEIILDVPESYKEVIFRNKLDFDEKYNNILEYLQECVKEPDKYSEIHYLYLMLEGLSAFFGRDLSDFMGISAKDVLGSTESLLERHIEMYNTNTKIDTESLSSVLEALYVEIWHLSESYRYDCETIDYEFEYKGEKFKIFQRYSEALFTKTPTEYFDPLTVGELVEAFEVSRRVHTKFANADIASKNLTEFLGILAVLARKEGELLPMSNTDQFIESRSAFFVDIDLKTVSDVFFYLIASLSTQKKSELISGSLTLLSTQVRLMNTSNPKSTITEKLGQEQALEV